MFEMDPGVAAVQLRLFCPGDS